ncbi:hypothetical protein HT031_001034 [Scenedesmus sp. PABB004]|nr:hypothetical protein HT031_001034 [Scenedesmus sp. PABB004]
MASSKVMLALALAALAAGAQGRALLQTTQTCVDSGVTCTAGLELSDAINVTISATNATKAAACCVYANATTCGAAEVICAEGTVNKLSPAALAAGSLPADAQDTCCVAPTCGNIDCGALSGFVNAPANVNVSTGGLSGAAAIEACCIFPADTPKTCADIADEPGCPAGWNYVAGNANITINGSSPATARAACCVATCAAHTETPGCPAGMMAAAANVNVTLDGVSDEMVAANDALNAANDEACCAWPANATCANPDVNANTTDAFECEALMVPKVLASGAASPAIGGLAPAAAMEACCSPIDPIGDFLRAKNLSAADVTATKANCFMAGDTTVSASGMLTLVGNATNCTGVVAPACLESAELSVFYNAECTGAVLTRQGDGCTGIVGVGEVEFDADTGVMTGVAGAFPLSEAEALTIAPVAAGLQVTQGACVAVYSVPANSTLLERVVPEAPAPSPSPPPRNSALAGAVSRAASLAAAAAALFGMLAL